MRKRVRERVLGDEAGPNRMPSDPRRQKVPTRMSFLWHSHASCFFAFFCF